MSLKDRINAVNSANTHGGTIVEVRDADKKNPNPRWRAVALAFATVCVAATLNTASMFDAHAQSKVQSFRVAQTEIAATNLSGSNRNEAAMRKLTSDTVDTDDLEKMALGESSHIKRPTAKFELAAQAKNLPASAQHVKKHVEQPAKSSVKVDVKKGTVSDLSEAERESYKAALRAANNVDPVVNSKVDELKGAQRRAIEAAVTLLSNKSPTPVPSVNAPAAPAATLSAIDQLKAARQSSMTGSLPPSAKTPIAATVAASPVKPASAPDADSIVVNTTKIMVDGKVVEVISPFERIRICQIVAQENNLAKHGLDWKDIYAIIHAETGWNARDGMGLNGKISRGLAQLEDATSESLGIKNPYDIKQAVTGVAKLLKEAADWSRARGYDIKGMDIKGVALSLYYNTTSKLRNAWDGKDIDNLPTPTKNHITNVAHGRVIAENLFKKLSVQDKESLKMSIIQVSGQKANSSTTSNNTQRMKGVVASSVGDKRDVEVKPVQVAQGGATMKMNLAGLTAFQEKFNKIKDEKIQSDKFAFQIRYSPPPEDNGLLFKIGMGAMGAASKAGNISLDVSERIANFIVKLPTIPESNILSDSQYDNIATSLQIQNGYLMQELSAMTDDDGLPLFDTNHSDYERPVMRG